MRICIAQHRPFIGDLAKNIAGHIKIIEKASQMGADYTLFPELSITGYEPGSANSLAIAADDSRLQIFQQIADQNKMVVGIGAPLVNDPLPYIAMILFHPKQLQQIYYKQYLHQDEEPYFSSGENDLNMIRDTKIGLAICYEISVSAHAQEANQKGAKFYLASVAKTHTGVDKALIQLSTIAKKYNMTVLLSNCLGSSSEGIFGGKSSILDSEGSLKSQLDDENEGLVIIDTETQSIKKYLFS